MNRKFMLLIGFLMMTITTQSQAQRIDSAAVYILGRTTESLQYIKSCSFKAVMTYDIYNESLGLIKHSINEKVSMKFPDKMKITSSGDKGNRSLWYNGKTLYYYSFDNNTYAVTDAPKSVIQTIDETSKKFGIEFPAADFFYETFLDDLKSEQGTLMYLGKTIIDDKECFHIAGKDKNKSFQFWIGNDDNFLPIKMAIVYTNDKDKPQYEAVYKDWIVNPDFSDYMFEFSIPPKASKIKLQPREEKK
ncbi:DUF2092 domain-containing protein [Flavobacterium johnsoniae]|uniref:DUF2092 domain-containing protein n=1 Tax=Flavobacterium johnsoniae TaxID=986 RepID=UPI0025B12F46|nr:DUF2092 domain-containing protein [Flavobacterium johnsoniae]WJS95889.1 DUF2092 domain-containing protein [Flavobacterium johnsoniae]